MFWSVAAPILGSIAGDIISGSMARSGQAEANAANAREMALNRQFQEDMSNTAMQRRVKDLRAAGLNPMLAYSQGGASTPTGGAATYQNENTGMANALANITNKFLNMATLDKQRELMQAQIDATIASGSQASAQTANIRVQTENLYRAQTGLEIDNAIKALEVTARGMDVNSRIELYHTLIQKANDEARDMRNRADISGYRRSGERIESEFQEAYGKYERAANAVLGGVGDIVDLANPLRALFGKKRGRETSTTIQRDSRGREVGRDTYTRED